ncbi:CHAT domain-containing protein [Streptomyces sp. CA-251387]|uniref:CHAT domain-containing protein n=1 Tax=Streptomyces sp. CA-251387 TaxID=3240064 RepID=UPI003D938A6F
MDDEPITAVRAFLGRSGDLTEHDVEAAQRLLTAVSEEPEPDAAATAVAGWRHIVAATADDDPALPHRLMALSQVLRIAFACTLSVDDLDAAVDAAAKAVAAVADTDHPNLPVYRSSLAVMLLTRFDHGQEPGDLDAAVEALHQVVSARPPADDGDPQLLLWLQALAADLKPRLPWSGDLSADLDLLSRVSGRIVDEQAPDDPSRGHWLAQHAENLYLRFHTTGDRADIDTAVDSLRQAAEATPAGSPERPGLLSGVAALAFMSYQSSRDLHALDLSVAAGREALALGVADEDRAGVPANLSTALRNRFEHTGEPADLDAAIEIGRQAVDTFPADDPDAATAVFNLGAAHHIRYVHRRAPEDLQAAMAHLRRAVDLAPVGHPSHVMAWSSLGLALRSRFEGTGDLADLDAAVEAGQRALDHLPADDPGRSACQANLDGTLLVRLRHTGVDATEELAERIHAWASGAVQFATEDAERGLTRIEETLDLCTGIPALAKTVAYLGYNRAAALRALGRPEEAEAAYRTVVEDFASHPDPDVALWVGVALFNTVTLVLESSGDPVAAEQVPPLVDRLREHVAGHDHPWLERRLRIALRLEAELLEGVGRTEQAQKSRARLRAVLQPAVEQVLGLLEAMEESPVAVDDVTPRFARDRESLVVPLLEHLDESLDVVRELADAAPENLVELVEPHPTLLSFAALQMITAVKDGQIPGAESDEDRDRIERGLERLGSVFHHLYERPAAYPLRAGPFETLFNAVDASISMPDALEYARSVGMVGALSLPYARALVEEGVGRLHDDGQWQRAQRLQLLVLAAAERLPNSDEGRAIVTMARFSWIGVARQVLIMVPDGRVLHSARDAGERVLCAYAADGEEEPGNPADVLIALAALHLDPHVDLYIGSDEAIIAGEFRRWMERRGEYVLDPVEVPDEVSEEIPDTTDMLRAGEEYLRRALAVAEGAQQGFALSMMLNLHKIRTALGHEPPQGHLAQLADRAVTSVDAEAYPHLMAQALVAQLAAGVRPDPTTVDRLLSRSIDEIAAQVGGGPATSVLISAGHLLGATDRARALRIFADAEGFVRALPERDRMKVLLVQHDLLSHPFEPSDLDGHDPDPGTDPGDAAVALLERAKIRSWPQARAAVALLTLSVRGVALATDPEDELAWLAGLRTTRRVFSDDLAGHHDALATLTAAWCTVASYRAHERGDWEHAIRTQGAACAEYLALPAPDAAMESLTLIAKAVAEARGVGLATVTVNTLGPLAVRAENLIGAAATEVLQTIWARVIGAVRDRDDVAALFACLQLAKGARFVDALHADVRFDARADESSQHLLALIGQIGDEPERDLTLDAVTLSTPYTEQLDAGNLSPARQRENLERTFDAHVQRLLTGEQTPLPLSMDTVLDLLPADTVLLYTYLSHDEDGGRSLLSLVATNDRLTVVTQPLLDAEHAGLRTQITIDGRVRVHDVLGAATFQLRRAVLAEPGPVRPVTRWGEEELDQGLPALFGPVTDELRKAYALGKRHLVIVPHGALHHAPLHLLHLDGKPLADTWTVTYLPTIALLERATKTHDGARTLTSVGLGFTDGPLPPLPEAVEEATAVAECFRTTALLDERATEEAVLAALGSTRLFHIATHGMHNVTAPAFQSLYVADERVSAHELLRLDLSGLDLVTLSACETALGRFDAADNLRGIPASLLLRGASALVGTLWPVETLTSRDFFTTLYGELRQGSSRLDAFTEAQRRTRAGHPQYRDWGAFYYIGDWR